MLHLRVDEAIHLGEFHDLVELRGDLGAAHTKDGAAQEHVLATRQVRMKAGSNLQQGADASDEIDAAGGRFDNAREDLEQRALAGAIAADDPDDVAVRHVERDVVERPEALRRLSVAAPPERPTHAADTFDERFSNRAMGRSRAELVLLAEVRDANRGLVDHRCGDVRRHRRTSVPCVGRRTPR